MELAPAPILDGQNFYADPIWREVLETENYTNERGGRSTRPKTPYEHQRLQQVFQAPLPPDLQGRAKALSQNPGRELVFHEDGSRNDGRLIILTLVEYLFRLDDEAVRRRVAEFTLDALQPRAGILDLISDLAKRPGASTALDYPEGIHMPYPHIGVLNDLQWTLTARALAKLSLGRSDSAAKDLLLLLRLSETIRNEPLFLSLVTRAQMLKKVSDVIAFGIRRHSWEDAQLADFEVALAGINLLPQLALSFRGERGSLNQLVESWPKSSTEIFEYTPGPLAHSIDSYLIGYPILHRLCFEMGWRLFNSSDQSRLNHATQAGIDAIDRAPGHGITPKNFRIPSDPFSYSIPFFSSMQRTDTEDWRMQFHPLAQFFGMSNLNSVVVTICHAQDRLSLARVACALERYRLRHGSYPKSLDALEPDFLAKLPVGVLATQKIRYRTGAPDDYVLWTAGWNESDENGQRGLSTNGRPISRQGDWVWWEPIKPLPVSK